MLSYATKLLYLTSVYLAIAGLTFLFSVFMQVRSCGSGCSFRLGRLLVTTANIVNVVIGCIYVYVFYVLANQLDIVIPPELSNTLDCLPYALNIPLYVYAAWCGTNSDIPVSAPSSSFRNISWYYWLVAVLMLLGSTALLAVFILWDTLDAKLMLALTTAFPEDSDAYSAIDVVALIVSLTCLAMFMATWPAKKAAVHKYRVLYHLSLVGLGLNFAFQATLVFARAITPSLPSSPTDDDMDKFSTNRTVQLALTVCFPQLMAVLFSTLSYELECVAPAPAKRFGRTLDDHDHSTFNPVAGLELSGMPSSSGATDPGALSLHLAESINAAHNSQSLASKTVKAWN
jgi:hypothetical protein